MVESNIMNRPTSITSAKVNAIVIALCALLAVPLIALSAYDRPSADDFSYSLKTHAAFEQTGGDAAAVLGAAVETDVDFYNSWQGLYTSAFLLALQPGIAGGSWYGAGAVLIMAFMAAACLYLAFCVERRALRAPTKLWPAAGCMLATLFMQCMPYANEGIYWYNGAANYTPAFFLSFFSAGLCITALSAESRARCALAVAGAAVVSLIASGGNYMPAFFNLMSMAAFAGIGLLKRRPALVAPLVAAACGFAVSALAPGTAIRQAALSELFGKPTVAGTLAHSAYQAVMDLRLFVDLPVLVFFAAVTPLIVIWARRSRIRFSWKALAVGCVVAFVFMVGVLCVPYYAAGSFGEGRTRDAAFFADLTLVAGLYGYAVCCAATRWEAAGKRAEAAVAGLRPWAVGALASVALAAVALYGSQLAGHGNSLIAARSLADGEAAAYAAEYDAREAALLSAVGGEAAVPELSTRPQLLFYADFVRNEDDWSGVVAAYYGLERIVVER